MQNLNSPVKITTFESKLISFFLSLTYYWNYKEHAGINEKHKINKLRLSPQKQKVTINDNLILSQKIKNLPLILSNNVQRNTKYAENSASPLKHINFNEFLDTTQQLPYNLTQASYKSFNTDKNNKLSKVSSAREIKANAISYSRAIEDLNDRSITSNPLSASIDLQSYNNSNVINKRVYKLLQKSVSGPNLTDQCRKPSSIRIQNQLIFKPLLNLKGIKGIDLSTQSREEIPSSTVVEENYGLLGSSPNKRPLTASVNRIVPSFKSMNTFRINASGPIISSRKSKNVKNIFGYNGIHKKLFNFNAENGLGDVFMKNSYDILSKKTDEGGNNLVFNCSEINIKDFFPDSLAVRKSPMQTEPKKSKVISGKVFAK